MVAKPTSEEATKLKRVGDEPWYWLRENVPEVGPWEREFYDLLENIKVLWEQYRVNRINLAFLVNWSTASTSSGSQHIKDVSMIQKKQNAGNSQFIFEINLEGFVRDEIDMGTEIDPTMIAVFSQARDAVIIWFGDSLDILYKGMKWNPKNKAETLKEMKLKKRDKLMPLIDYKKILDIHYQEYIRGEAGVDYWFQGKKDKILLNSPERIFQKNLFMFLKNDCECDAALEPMFKNSSRCDVRASIDYDIYFFEIKWIGLCATKKENTDVISAENPREESIKNAIAGAYQTKTYIEQNNSVQYDNKIKMGIVVVYDGYSPPQTPIDYPAEIRDFPLLDTAEYQLVTLTPSALGKQLAKQKKRTSKKR